MDLSAILNAGKLITHAFGCRHVSYACFRKSRRLILKSLAKALTQSELSFRLGVQISKIFRIQCQAGQTDWCSRVSWTSVCFKCFAAC